MQPPRLAANARGKLPYRLCPNTAASERNTAASRLFRFTRSNVPSRQVRLHALADGSGRAAPTRWQRNAPTPIEDIKT